MLGGRESRVPPRILRFIRGRHPFTRSLVIRAQPFSDVTLFVLTLAQELGKAAQLGVNYINTGSPEKLGRRYPDFRNCFSRDGLGDGWLRLPLVRNVPRDHLRILLEVIQFGRDGSTSLSDDDLPDAPGGDEQEIGGSFHPHASEPPPEKPAYVPILPEFERLWDYLERCTHIPALLIVDSMNGLAARYGLEAAQLVDVIQKDLVDTGCASVVYVFEGEDQPPWFSAMDGILSWAPIRNHGLRRHWLLTIEYLVGRVMSPVGYVMSMDGVRLFRLPSDAEVVDMLDRMLEGKLKHSRPRIPEELIESLRETSGDMKTPPE